MIDFFAHIADETPLTSYATHDALRPVEISLRKGQKVALKNGRVVTIEGESTNYFWVVKESLPYSKSEIMDSAAKIGKSNASF